MATRPTNHDDFRDQAGVYVLGALTAQERAAFEAHLLMCAECAAEVRSLTPIAGALAQLAPQTEPPAALRASVLTAIGAPGTSRIAETIDETGYSRRSALARRSALEAGARVSASRAWLAAAASLALAIGLAAYAAGLHQQIGALEVRLRETMLRANAASSAIADARRAAADAQSQVAVLAAPDLARVDLAGQPVAPHAAARAFWSRSRGLVFTASNLPALPAGRTYQLWVLSAEAPPFGSGLILKPDADGRVTRVFQTPADLPKPTAMAVTIEPEGGVPAPTGDKYLVGSAN